MKRGGYRPGSGRKLGSPDKIIKNTKILEEVQKKYAGLFKGKTLPSPLEVMLLAMNKAADEEDWDTAVNRASLCAPYLHPKLAQTEQKITVESLSESSTVEERVANVFGASAPKLNMPGSDAIN